MSTDESDAPIPANQMRVAAKPEQRRKVPLPPGRSQLDWMRNVLAKPPPNPRSAPIAMDEVRQHNTPTDAWVVLKGNVYDVTEYLEYHPGGVDKLMLGAGKDATSLFEKYHPWVNYEAMIGRYLIGRAAGAADGT